MAPRSQTLRRPFLRRTVVRVAVVTVERVSMVAWSRGIRRVLRSLRVRCGPVILVYEEG
jgi:ribosomal protein L31E